MKVRLISAAVLLPVLLIVILALPTIVTAVLLALAAAVAAYELLYQTELVRHTRLVIYSMVTAALVPVWCWSGIDQAWIMLLVLAFSCALFGEMMRSHIKLRFETVALCLVAGLFIPYLFSGLVRILVMEEGRKLIFVPLILAFIPDSGAYFAGMYFGRHKLAPVISPKKTVEGAIGGCVTAILGMLLYTLIMQLAFSCQVNYAFALIYGIVGSLGDIFGDLMFSVIKRQTGIKDYGRLIPGHGGILDRFDSMIIVAPLAEVLLALLPVVV